MSTLSVDAVSAKTLNTNLTLTGNGTGKVVLGDGSLVFPDADGSADQIIKTDGSGNLSFQDAGGGGARNVISSGSFVSASELVITDITGSFKVEIYLTPLSGNPLYIQVSTDNGVSWKSGASDYCFGVQRQSGGGSTAGIYNSSTAASKLDIGYGGGLIEIDVNLPENSGVNTYFVIEKIAYSSATAASNFLFSAMGTRLTAEVNNAVRFYWPGAKTGKYVVSDLSI